MMPASFTGLGLILGTLFFAASLTPSLVPRPPVVQGVLSGVCLAAGYAIGVLFRAVWLGLQLPVPAGAALRIGRLLALGLCVAAAGVCAVAGLGMAEPLRALMELARWMARALLVALVALVIFGLLLLLGRLFRVMLNTLSHWLRRRVPGPVAVLVALIVTAAIFWQVGNGVIAGAVMRTLDGIYARLDAAFEEGSPQPTDPLKTGAPRSL
jgi:uncharacterized membrane protein